MDDRETAEQKTESSPDAEQADKSPDAEPLEVLDTGQDDDLDISYVQINLILNQLKRIMGPIKCSVAK